MKEGQTIFPKWVWLMYIALFACSLPWYLPESLESKIVLGLPFWVVASIGVMALLAGFTFWAINKYWKDEEMTDYQSISK